MTMRYLTIILLCLLTACRAPGAINYTEQPTADTVPPPIGVWTRTPTICVDDRQVYLSHDAAAVPAGLQAQLAGIVPDAVQTFCAEVHTAVPAVSYRWLDDPNNVGSADIPVRLYYGHVDTTSTIVDKGATADLSELEKWLLLIGVTAIIANADIHGGIVGLDTTGTSPETEGAVMNLLNRNPPPADAGYNGVCFYTHRGDTLTATSVWINVGDIVEATPEYQRYFLTLIPRHELGHALCGLNDNTYKDAWPCVAGLMSYCWMTMWFSDDELATVRWLYE